MRSMKAHGLMDSNEHPRSPLGHDVHGFMQKEVMAATACSSGVRRRRGSPEDDGCRTHCGEAAGTPQQAGADGAASADEIDGLSL